LTTPIKRTPRALIALGLVLALAVAASACTKKSDSGNANGSTSQPSAETPAFDFSVGRVLGISATPTQEKGITPKSKPTAADVATFMTALYKAQFLDPANWQNGDYSSAWAMYDGQALSDAKKNVDVLTLGTDAGSKYDTVTPSPAKQNLPVKVLLDAKNKPMQAVATVTFTAKAKGSDGTTTITSQGQYLLAASGGGWKVYGFSVTQGSGAGGTTTKASSEATP
jgi:hypothetical protein